MTTRTQNRVPRSTRRARGGRSRLWEWIGGLLAAAVLVALVAGIPAALLALGRGLPIRLPTGDLWRILTSPDDGGLLLLALLAVGWIAWASFAASVAVEALAALRGLPAPRLPGLAVTQRAASSLVAATAILLTPATAFATTGSPAPEPGVSAPSTLAGPATPTDASVAADATGPARHEAHLAHQAHLEHLAHRARTGCLPTVTVGRYDTLWGLAERHLGAGPRYTEIHDLNSGRRQPDGHALRDPDIIHPGWVLRLPADARNLPRAVPADATGTPTGATEPGTPAATRSVPAEAGNPTSAVVPGPATIDATATTGNPTSTPKPRPATEQHPTPTEDPTGAAEPVPAAPTSRAADTVAPDGSRAPTTRPSSTASTRASSPTTPTGSPTTEPVPASDSALAAGRVVGGRIPAEPSLDPGLPDTAAGTLTDARPTPGTTDGPASNPASTVDDAAAAGVRSDGTAPVVDDDEAPLSLQAELALPVGLIAGLAALTLTGLVAELALRRRRQQAHRRPGQRLDVPAPDAARLEATAASTATPVTVDTLRAALRQLAHGCAEQRRRLPDVRLVHVGPAGITLQLAEPDQRSVAPFTAVTPDRWRLDADATRDLPDPADVPDPYPALVALGVTDDAQLLLNLESVGTLHVVGPPDARDAVLRALAVDLAVGPLSGQALPILAGCFPDLTATLDPTRVRHDRPAHAARTVTARITTETGRDRRTSGVDRDPPGIVLTTDPFTVAPDPWAGAVVIDTTAAATGLTLDVADDGTATLRTSGIRLDVQRLAPSDYAAVLELLAVADRDPQPDRPAANSRVEEAAAVLDALGPATPEPLDADDQRLDLPAATTIDLADQGTRGAVETADADQPLPDVAAPRLLLLGPVVVEGAVDVTAPERRRRITELIAFLSLNPDATAHHIDEAIWSGQRVERGTRNSLVYRARQWLGDDPTGQPYLPRLRDGELVYRLHPAVSTDWRDFQRLARRGLSAGDAGLADLDAALALVRGRPFLGINPRDYAWAEPLIQDMISTIVDTAHLAAGMHLDRGEARAALRAATIGLGVDDASDLLLDDAEHAAAQLGDTDTSRRLRTRRVLMEADAFA